MPFVNGRFLNITLPYPMGFFAKNVDGRIDDPNAGWKARLSGQRTGHERCSISREAERTGQKAVKLQLRPNRSPDKRSLHPVTPCLSLGRLSCSRVAVRHLPLSFAQHFHRHPVARPPILAAFPVILCVKSSFGRTTGRLGPSSSLVFSFALRQLMASSKFGAALLTLTLGHLVARHRRRPRTHSPGSTPTRSPATTSWAASTRRH
jgi:hypothetical protein